MKTLQRSVHMIAALGAALFTTVLAIPAPAWECPESVGFAPQEPNGAIAVSGDYAYIALNDTGTGGGGLHVIDVSAPMAPTQVGTLDASWQGARVAVSGDYVLVAAYSDGLRVVDVNIPEMPVEVAGAPGGNVVDLVVEGRYAYLADADFGLRVLDFNDPMIPVEVGSFPLLYVQTIAMSGSYAYVSHAWGPSLEDSRLTVIDVSDPGQPLLHGSCIVEATTFSHLAVFGEHLFGIGSCPGLICEALRVIDVSDPSMPTVAWTGGGVTLGHSHGVAISGNIAYAPWSQMLFTSIHELRVFDLTNPTSPQIVCQVGTEGFANAGSGVVVSGGYVYVTESDEEVDGGLEVFDDCASVFSDGFESGDCSVWSSTVP